MPTYIANFKVNDAHGFVEMPTLAQVDQAQAFILKHPDQLDDLQTLARMLANEHGARTEIRYKGQTAVAHVAHVEPDAIQSDAYEAAREKYAKAAAAPSSEPVAWAVERWNAEVANRPMVNVHRRTLDDTWRQVIRYFGGDDRGLLGLTHDELLAGHSLDSHAECSEPDVAKAVDGTVASWPAPQAAQDERAPAKQCAGWQETVSIKEAYAAYFGNDAGWTDVQGSYFISGYQVARAALATPPMEGETKRLTDGQIIDLANKALPGWTRKDNDMAYIEVVRAAIAAMGAPTK